MQSLEFSPQKLLSSSKISNFSKGDKLIDKQIQCTCVQNALREMTTTRKMQKFLPREMETELDPPSRHGK